MPGPGPVVGSFFEDNKVTYDSNIPPSWVKLVQNKVKIPAGETAEQVTGYDSTISYRFYPGLPPPPSPIYFSATSTVEWKKGETVTITGGPKC